MPKACLNLNVSSHDLVYRYIRILINFWHIFMDGGSTWFALPYAILSWLPRCCLFYCLLESVYTHIDQCPDRKKGNFSTTNIHRHSSKSEFHIIPSSLLFVTTITPFSRNFPILPHLVKLVPHFIHFKFRSILSIEKHTFGLCGVRHGSIGV
jgi:hypothetical protein